MNAYRVVPVIACLVLSVLLLVLLGAGPAAALPAGAVRHVAPGGNCGSVSLCYASIQAAVDAAAAGDEVRIAAGTYSQVSVRPRADIAATGVVTQVVYLVKTLTLRGGYSPANWTTPDPAANPTMLDPQGQGRGIYISGAARPISVTIEGLEISGGDAVGQGGEILWDYPYDAGGAVYAISSTLTLRDSLLALSQADRGGGLYLGYGTGTLVGNTFDSNLTTYGGMGAGLVLRGCRGVRLADNDVAHNTALAGDGGGLEIDESTDIVVAGNDFTGNESSEGRGGAVSVFDGQRLTFSDNRFIENNALEGSGGGLSLWFASTISLTRNELAGNASSSGGGLSLIGADNAALADNRFEENTSGMGGGLELSSAQAITLTGNDFLANSASQGGGVSCMDCQDLTATGNRFWGNSAVDASGGGLDISSGVEITLSDNDFRANSASEGGGVYCLFCDALTLADSRFWGNEAVGSGGGGVGILFGSEMALRNNEFISNTAGFGGAVSCVSCDSGTVAGNTLRENIAAEEGGGIEIGGSVGMVLADNLLQNNRAALGGGVALYGAGIGGQDVTMVNTVITGNRASSGGGGLFVGSAAPRLLHCTIAGNVGPEAIQIRANTNVAPPLYSAVWLTNTILVSHSVGINISGGSRVSANGLLWYRTPITVSAAPTATVVLQHAYVGDPAFTADGYHLQGTSAAIDRGVPAGVATDIDGQPRPNPATGIPDLGADEFYGPAGSKLYLPVVLRNH